VCSVSLLSGGGFNKGVCSVFATQISAPKESAHREDTGGERCLICSAASGSLGVTNSVNTGVSLRHSARGFGELVLFL
jgi:hypothetical protein